MVFTLSVQLTITFISITIISWSSKTLLAAATKQKTMLGMSQELCTEKRKKSGYFKSLDCYTGCVGTDPGRQEQWSPGGGGVYIVSSPFHFF